MKSDKQVNATSEKLTDKRVTANRRNARRSTGPSSARGKAVARLNAVRHGLTAEDMLIPGEDAKELRTLKNRLHRELAPEGELEGELVERISALLWRLRRATRAEAGLFALHYGHITQDRIPRPNPYLDLVQVSLTAGMEEEDIARMEVAREDARAELRSESPTRGLAWERVFKDVDALSKLGRHERRIELALSRALAQLKGLQEARRKEPVTIDVKSAGR